MNITLKKYAIFFFTMHNLDNRLDIVNSNGDAGANTKIGYTDLVTIAAHVLAAVWQ